MIRLSVLYPATEGATFDHDYYRDHHVPLAASAWSLDGVEQILRNVRRIADRRDGRPQIAGIVPTAGGRTAPEPPGASMSGCWLPT